MFSFKCWHYSMVNRKYQLQNYHFQGRRIKPRFILHKLFAISNCDVKYWSFADCINIQYWSLSQSLVLSRNASISLGKEKKSTSSNCLFCDWGEIHTQKPYEITMAFKFFERCPVFRELIRSSKTIFGHLATVTRWPAQML